MSHFTDQLGRTITLDQRPRRIISLVPSQTELLYSLGLNEEVTGITKFCVHPETWFRSKPRVGGTKDVRIASVRELKPDLIIANKEENDKEQIEELSRHYPVWISDIGTLTEALQMITAIGELTGKEKEARALATEIGDRFATLKVPQHSVTSLPHQGLSPATPPRTAYFIWRRPWMVAGGDTFIHDMLHRCGLTNLFADKARYPSIELEALAASGCELVLLSSEPYPFREKHIAEIRAVLPQADIRLADGELFSWYGSRLLEAPAYFQNLLGRKIP
ncbi:MAG TPA: helical backbone metal receptor [Puia sp.]|nr:helical backbone metal receptor [Puia sp.]